MSTVMIAAALGYVVQYNEASPRVLDAAQDDRQIASRSLMLSTNAQGQPVFGMPASSTAPTDHNSSQRQVMAVNVIYPELAVPHMGPLFATPIQDCDTGFSVARGTAAIASLSVDAPCLADRTVAVAHAGMIVSLRTDDEGKATINIPVLQADALFTLQHDNLIKAQARIMVPELRNYDRAVLQWAGSDNMRLHAFENGAAPGDPGHVWSASVHTERDMRAGRNGFVVYLGDAAASVPYQAEIYTFPARRTNQTRDIDLRMGVKVTADNCGRKVDATTIRMMAGETLERKRIVAQMPDCDQVGQVEMLAGKFDGGTIASN